ILQDLRVDGSKGRTLCFESRKGFLLIIERHILALLLIGRFAPFKQVVVEPTALFKDFVECLKLVLRRIQAIRKHFPHTYMLAQMRTFVRGGYPIPMPKGKGLSLLLVKCICG